MNRAALEEQAAAPADTGITADLWRALLDLRAHASDSAADAHVYAVVLRSEAARYLRRGGRS